MGNIITNPQKPELAEPLLLLNTNSMIVQNFYPEKKSVLLTPISDLQGYQQAAHAYVHQLNHKNGTSIEFKTDESSVTTMMMMKTNNTFANAYTRPIEAEDENAYIQISQVHMEYFPRLSITQLVEHADVMIKLTTLHQRDAIEVKRQVNNYLNTISTPYKYTKTNDEMNTFHRQELKIYVSSSSTDTNEKKEQDRDQDREAEVINYRIQWLGKDIFHFQDCLFMWTKYSASVYEQYKQKYASVDHIKPIGYPTHRPVKIIKISDPKIYNQYKEDQYTILLKQTEYFYELYCDSNLRVIIMDNDMEDVNSYELRKYKLFYWYFDNKKHQRVYGTFVFDWINSQFVFSLIQSDLSTDKTIYIQSYAVDTLDELLWCVLPDEDSRLLVKNNLYIVT